MGKPDANGDVWPDPDDESAGVTTAHDELRRIAETNTGDAGTLARILLAGIEGDKVAPDEPVPAVTYEVGERRKNPDDGLLYEYTDQGWVRVDQLAQAEVPAPTTPAAPDFGNEAKTPAEGSGAARAAEAKADADKGGGA